jgi:hypothetical protein
VSGPPATDSPKAAAADSIAPPFIE